MARIQIEPERRPVREQAIRRQAEAGRVCAASRARVRMNHARDRAAAAARRRPRRRIRRGAPARRRTRTAVRSSRPGGAEVQTVQRPGGSRGAARCRRCAARRRRRRRPDRVIGLLEPLVVAAARRGAARAGRAAARPTWRTQSGRRRPHRPAAPAARRLEQDALHRPVAEPMAWPGRMRTRRRGARTRCWSRAPRRCSPAASARFSRDGTSRTSSRSGRRRSSSSACTGTQLL
jgi:hypothetical protein